MTGDYTIQSDMNIASHHATAIANANEKQKLSVLRDEQTTVLGNQAAHTEIENLGEIQLELSRHITSIIQNIHSLAEEFEDKDALLRQQFSGRIQPLPKWQTNGIRSEIYSVLDGE